MFFISPKIELKRCDDDRIGVFCKEPIKEGDIIESSPIILLDSNKWEEVDPVVQVCALPWPELREDWESFCNEHGGILALHATRPAIGCGYSMLYKRDYEHNVQLKIEKKLFACQLKSLSKQ